MVARWSIWSVCIRASSACWSPNRPAQAIVRSGILFRILPRANSASTRGSRSPAISASIMSRADNVVMLEATESIWMPPSSKTDDIRFPARDVLHVPGVDQQHLDLLGLTQRMEHRLPVHPGRFHRHMGDALLHQPGHHLPEHLVVRPVLADPLAPLPRTLARRADSDRDLPLAHIDPRHPRIDDLHGLSSSSANPPEPAGHAARGTRKEIQESETRALR